MSLVKKQMETAQKFLELVDSLDPNLKPLLAGGAPRDWDVGKEAKDCDIWITDCFNGPRSSLIRHLAIEAVNLGLPTGRPDWIFRATSKDRFIKAICNIMIDDVEMQLIFVECSEPQEVIGRFCCNLSEAIYDHHAKTILKSPAYLRGRREKVCLLHNSPDQDYRRIQDGYEDRMRAKFPDYTFEYD